MARDRIGISHVRRNLNSVGWTPVSLETASENCGCSFLHERLNSYPESQAVPRSRDKLFVLRTSRPLAVTRSTHSDTSPTT